MAFWDDLAEGNLGTALVVAVGAVVLMPLARNVLRPAAKMAIKGGLLAYDGAVRLTEDARAEMGGLVREARAEHEARPARPATRQTSPDASKSSDVKTATA